MDSKGHKVNTTQLFGLIFIAYIFSFFMRLIWVFQFQDNTNFIWNDQLMINTNDGYFFASAVQKALYGAHIDNPRVFGMWDYGLVFFTTLFSKITPFSLETVTLYMSAIISSMVVIPIILIARLYKMAVWGFFAALLGSITWSYYNRTMVGYYDTDMFAAMAPMFILYFLMKSIVTLKLREGLYASVAITLYPFLYDAGLSIVFAMGLMYAAYMIFYHSKEETTYYSLMLIFIALIPLQIVNPIDYIVKIIILIVVYFILMRISLRQKTLILLTGFIVIFSLYFGHFFSLIAYKLSHYLASGTTKEGLHFYSVIQTVREAGQIPFETFANRISGSVVGVIIAFVGYGVLVYRYRAFILALPLMGIGVFSLFGGLRFTVYAVPVAALSAIYLFFLLGELFNDKRVKNGFVLFATAAMLYPNITHIINYKVPTVLNKAEVEDLVKLDKIASNKDYTLAWWDYGYPIWYYSNTSTLIDGGKHNNDNFIISKIMQTTSPDLAANLSRLAVETYVDSNYSVVADRLFKNEQEGQLDPNLFMTELEDENYKLPAKTRDIYLYLPYRMLNIFPTVSIFGNIDLTTGKQIRNMAFYPTRARANDNGRIVLANGIVFDAKKGVLNIGRETKDVKYFIITQNTNDGKTKLQSQLYQPDGEYAVVYMKSYGQFVVMDMQTFKSMYVQMFILGKYDKRFFELVVSSPYSKIYKLKK